MSCLSKSHRISKDSTFKDIYKSGKRWHTPSFVAYFKQSDSISAAFVASKKVGNAVKRNLAKRRLKALFLENERYSKLQSGKFIFVAKVEIEKIDFLQLQKEFNYSLKKIQN